MAEQPLVGLGQSWSVVAGQQETLLRAQVQLTSGVAHRNWGLVQPSWWPAAPAWLSMRYAEEVGALVQQAWTSGCPGWEGHII